ncbi:MAG: nucleotidyltransferase domain-containing protein, partial [Syntrophales bacterium]|nr:nucleotidyltransferase domain-containing protein [Syntrophales bacterium]
MAGEYFFREFQDNQQRTLNRAVEAYLAYLEAVQAGRPLKGGMHWKKVKGREYLYKYRDRYGHGSSLGPRSPHTERLWAEFGRQRREIAALLGARRQQLAEAARFCRAALIHRVLQPVTRILRYLPSSDLSAAPFMVIGAHALHAFEFAAGVFIDAPRDSCLIEGAASGLTLAAAAEVSPDAFLRLLRQADRSYENLPG